MLPKAALLLRALPKKVSRGACQEVIWEKVDLDRLPILHCWPKDGGRFITLPVITKDPESGRRNVGLYRLQVLDKKSTAMHWQIHKVGKQHFEAYKKRGEKTPVAVALGGEPALTYSATAPLPEALDEACFHNLCLLSIKKSYPGHAQKIMHSLWGMGQMMFCKCFIVVDQDVDVQNLKEVVWRVSNNIDAKRDMVFVGGPVDHLDHASSRQFVGSKFGHRCDP